MQAKYQPIVVPTRVLGKRFRGFHLLLVLLNIRGIVFDRRGHK